MITAPLSQATPSLLQRANQLPFKTGENEPQSTVTVPVEMAVSDGMESHAVDMTAENPGAWEIPEGIPPCEDTSRQMRLWSNGYPDTAQKNEGIKRLLAT